MNEYETNTIQKRRTSKDGWKIEGFCIEYAKL